jgi:hypothetical protein
MRVTVAPRTSMTSVALFSSPGSFSINGDDKPK